MYVWGCPGDKCVLILPDSRVCMQHQRVAWILCKCDTESTLSMFVCVCVVVCARCVYSSVHNAAPLGRTTTRSGHMVQHRCNMKPLRCRRRRRCRCRNRVELESCNTTVMRSRRRPFVVVVDVVLEIKIHRARHTAQHMRYLMHAIKHRYTHT